jgi:hypothetical protein
MNAEWLRVLPDQLQVVGLIGCRASQMESQLPCADEATTIKDCITSLPVFFCSSCVTISWGLSLTFA